MDKLTYSSCQKSHYLNECTVAESPLCIGETVNETREYRVGEIKTYKEGSSRWSREEVNSRDGIIESMRNVVSGECKRVKFSRLDPPPEFKVIK